MLPRISSFSQDQRGVIAVMYALLLVPVLGIGALALDTAQASMFRQRLQSVADSAARKAAAPGGSDDMRYRRDATTQTLRRLLADARMNPADVGARIDISGEAAEAGLVAVVTLEAARRPLISLGHGASAIRVTARYDQKGETAARSARLIRCHAVATQREFEALGC